MKYFTEKGKWLKQSHKNILYKFQISNEMQIPISSFFSNNRIV